MSRSQVRACEPLKIIMVFLCVFPFLSGENGRADSSRKAAFNLRPSAIPDRIILSPGENPARQMAVTWRTDSTVKQGVAELAQAESSSDFLKKTRQFHSVTSHLSSDSGPAHYHSVNFKKLVPNRLYVYRVGSRETWSEWFQFRTAGSQAEPFSFIFLGDAQNDILSLWSRVIRAAYSTIPTARFFIHAGDLVNHAGRDREWGEWFQAGGWIYAMVPNLLIPGNHEYHYDKQKNLRLSAHWRNQFTLPENGVQGMEETVYYLDYQGARIIGLNSNEKIVEQAAWLEKVLDNNPNRWTFVVFHHPVFSPRRKRGKKELMEAWRPLINRYRVDMVFQGHEHTYARGTDGGDQKSGTVYVISVSGPKMYNLPSARWIKRGVENAQLYQVISTAPTYLNYKAFTATGELVDAFDLVKRENKTNLLVERLSADKN